MGKLCKVTGILLILIGFIGNMIPLIILGLLVMFGGDKIVENRQSRVREQVEEPVIREVLDSMFQGVRYQESGSISKGTIDSAHMMFWNNYNDAEGSMRVDATYRERAVELGNVTLKQLDDIWDEDMNMYRQSSMVCFQGQWFLCDTGKEHMADVQIATSTRLDRLLRADTIQMQQEAFDKRFRVRSSDEQEAFRILTPRMMEYILKMADNCDGSLYISFLKNGFVHVAVQTERDFLNTKTLFTDVESVRKSFERQVRWFTDFVDEVMD